MITPNKQKNVANVKSYFGTLTRATYCFYILSNVVKNVIVKYTSKLNTILYRMMLMYM